MEQFKICEKETKTKAYSKEGLAAASKAKELTDDQEDALNWIDEQTDALIVTVFLHQGPFLL